jgi:predicted membrane protein
MLILFVILTSLVSVNISCYSQSGIITGRVYSQSTKATLENAKLILKRNNKYYRKIKTDHVGNYWFGELKTGNYSVWVIQEDYCQLEMGGIELKKSSSSIQLDLGLMENAKNTNLTSISKVYMVYYTPISINLDTTATAYQNFKNEIHIINEVYQGNEIRIARPRKSDPTSNSRATHYNEGLKGLEKSSSFIRRGF